MEDSPAHPLHYGRGVAGFDLARWKTAAATLFAVLLAFLFFVSGTWKLSAPLFWSQALTEFLVPNKFALPFTLLLGIAETFGAALVLVPRFRRWGGWLLGLLLIAFMLYIGMNYNSLVGKECSCFPLVKRTIGPGFFAGDLLMLILAAGAALWAQRPSGVRAAVVILAAIGVFAGVSYGVNVSRQSGLMGPDSIIVDGKSYSLRHGHTFLFFYDPECMHCDAAARRMAKLNWKETQVVGIPTRMPQFAADFLKDTHLRAGTSNDVQPLRGIFKFVDPPYGVALENGRQVAAVVNFDESEPAKTLRQAGFIE